MFIFPSPLTSPKSTLHKVIFDRIEAGTYIIASAITKGNLKIRNIQPKYISTEINLLNKMGVRIIKKKNYIVVSCPKLTRSSISFILFVVLVKLLRVILTPIFGLFNAHKGKAKPGDL